MKSLSYHLLHAIAYVLSLLPYWVLYGMADFFFVLVYFLIRYRRKVVRKNLTSSFPEKSLKDIKRIERRFYRWLCDYAVETIKLLSISDKAMARRLEFRNVDKVVECFARGQSCAAILGHYCNWEWLSATGLAFRTSRQEDNETSRQQDDKTIRQQDDKSAEPVIGLIYHPLYSDAFDRLFIDIRSAHGGLCVAKQDILRQLVTLRREQRKYFFGYISDQAPRWHNIHLWLPFLGHDTPVFTGGERIMRKMDDAVFYAEITRPRRGRYTCTFKLVSEHAKEEPDNAITIRFFQLLEQTIRQEPAFYLWTHNRWKRTHEEFDRQYVMVNGKAILKEEAQ